MDTFRQTRRYFRQMQRFQFLSQMRQHDWYRHSFIQYRLDPNQQRHFTLYHPAMDTHASEPLILLGKRRLFLTFMLKRVHGLHAQLLQPIAPKSLDDPISETQRKAIQNTWDLNAHWYISESLLKEGI